ncbi:HupE/UreJ family protein [Myxococcota bacterium]|nr:HupE/UreJ family protein [Myxococcota bacterium]MBU1432547.1 HupE/UreJ family protein [Myxococcota bacterium]MBU1898836.1 HupE/UreJ family protein [Myxococcota bacterium]
MRAAPLLIALALLGAAEAHQLHPAHLTLQAGPPTTATLRAPVVDGAVVPLRLAWPQGCAPRGPAEVRREATFELRAFTLDCAEGLRGALHVEGATQSETDVLTRVIWADGRVTDTVVSWRAPTLTLGADHVALDVWGYLPIGVEHILFGPDHLAFVFGLFLLVAGRWRALTWTTLAFTLGHSVTLAFAALGLFALPSAPVEAAIALSILILARALLREAEAGQAIGAPWRFALACGLLHGFGFAGALVEIGLPLEHTAAALALFNLGVEAGQLLFIGAAWVIAEAVTAPRLRRFARVGLIYLIGGLAAFWLIERVTPMLAALI